MKKTVPGWFKIIITIFLKTVSVFGSSDSSLFFKEPQDSAEAFLIQGYNVWNARAGGYHAGIDLYTKGGKPPVHATAQGKIVRIQANGPCERFKGPGGGCADHGLGNAIIVEHLLENGLEIYSLYAHLDEIRKDLRVGDLVHQNQALGIMGASGYGLPDYWKNRDGSPAIHVHFEIKDKGVLHDPAGGSSPSCSTCYGYTPTDPDNYGYHNPYLFFGKVKVRGQLPQDKSLVRVEGNDRVYWLQNEKAYHVLGSKAEGAISDRIIDDMSGIPGWGWDKVNVYSTNFLNPKPPPVAGTFLEAQDFIATDSRSNGLLIRKYGDSAVFLIQNGKRRKIDDPEKFFEQTKEYSSKDIIDVTQSILDLLPPEETPVFSNPTGKITGQVINDLNGNGIQDPGEPGEPFVRNPIATCTGTPVARVSISWQGPSPSRPISPDHCDSTGPFFVQDELLTGSYVLNISVPEDLGWRVVRGNGQQVTVSTGAPSRVEFFITQEKKSLRLSINKSNFCNGDRWTLSITNAPVFSDVFLSGWLNGSKVLTDLRIGTTDGNGNLTLSDIMPSGVSGSWQEQVTVAGQKSNIIDFQVANCNEPGIPVISLDKPFYCIGDEWQLLMGNGTASSSIDLYGITNGNPWSLLDWGKTESNGSFRGKGEFKPGTAGNYTLYVVIAGKESNRLSFSAFTCPSKALPTITSSLKLGQFGPYKVGQTISSQFEITNKGTEPIKFDVLTVGGRDPDQKVADFTWRLEVPLDTGQSYIYIGDLTLQKQGTYHFFTAYQTPDGKWNPSIPTEGGITNTLDISVSVDKPQPFSLSAVSTCSQGAPAVTLNWTPSEHAGAYAVYRNGSLVSNVGNQRSYADTSVIAGTSYSYLVRASNSAGTIDSNTVPISAVECADKVSPDVSISPPSGTPGTSFVFQGWSFSPEGSITSHLQKPDRSEFPTLELKADGKGNFTHRIDSTRFDPGTYTVWAVDNKTNLASKKVTFEVTKPKADPPEISVISPTRVVGSVFDLTITGSRFDSKAVDQIYKPDGTALGSGAVKSQSETQIIVTEHMAGVAPGTYTVKVKNSDDQFSNAKTLTLISQVDVSPASGGAGTPFILRGKGFTGNHGITSHLKKPDDSEFPTLQKPTITTGEFTHTINSAGFAPGTYQAWAVDNNTGIASDKISFTVIKSAPAAPSNLLAAAISTDKIDLSWKDNSDNEDGFKIERRTGASGSFSQIAQVGPNVNSYSDAGVEADTTYYYRIKAFNSAGDSVYSNEASATTGKAVAPQISVAPPSGAPGTSFSAKGSGFTPGKSVSSHLQKPDGPEFPVLRLVADSQGAFSHTIDSKNFAKGPYTLWAVDDTSGKPSNKANFTITDEAPSQPTNLSQFRSNGVTGLALGATTNEDAVVLKGGVSDPDRDQVKLEIELRRLDEFNGQFTGTPTAASSLLSSSSIASITVSGLINGSYHWQGRTVDATGKQSAWLEAGGNPTSAIDFIVSLANAAFLGAVRDKDGKLIPGATITARNQGTGETRTTVTGNDGSYQISNLQAGTYEIRAETSGFKSVTQTVVLAAGETKRVDFTLEVGVDPKLTIWTSFCVKGPSCTGDQGVTFNFDGTGFTPNGKATQIIRKPDNSQITGSLNVTSSGTISWTYPSSCQDQTGTYVIRVRDDASGKETNSVDEIITSSSQCNRAPNQPTSLSQFRSDGFNGIPLGGSTDESTVVLKGGVSDPDGDRGKLEVELRRLDEFGGRFLGSATHTSGLLSSGSTASITVFGLINGNYHWQARTLDEKGKMSEWLEAGGNSTAAVDFTVNVVTVNPTVSVSPPSGSPGTIFTVQGEKFSPNSTVISHLQKPDGSEFSTLQLSTDSQGRYSHSINSSNFATGIYKHWADDNKTSKPSNTVSFEVKEAPRPEPKISSISPSTVVGSTFELTINGSDFDPTGAIDKIYKPDGSFMGSGVVKNRNATQIIVSERMAGAAPGTYSVRVENPDRKVSNAVPLTLIAEVSVSPSSGPAGTQFSYRGRGFTGSHGVTSHLKKPDGSEFGTIQIATNTDGEFVHVINSAGFSAGTYEAWAIDNNTKIASTNRARFEVTLSALTAPSNLTASASSSTRIDLSWRDNSNDEGGFKIERMTGSSGFVEIATVGANVTSYADSGLSGQTTYCYRVRAFRGSEHSGYSNEACAGTSEEKPGSFTLTGKIGCSGTSPTVELSWDRSVRATSYAVYRNGSLLANVGLNQNYTDTSVSKNTEYSYFIRASNSAGSIDSNTLRFTPQSCWPTLTITTDSNLPTAYSGIAYSVQLQASGGTGQGYTWTLGSGSLPQGLTLSSSGLISGTPLFASSSTFDLHIQVKDSDNNASAKFFNLTVSQGPRVLNSSLPDGIAGISYTEKLRAEGGTPPYTFSATGLPEGLSLRSDGQFVGVPTKRGTYSVVVTLEDSKGLKVTQTFSLTIKYSTDLRVWTASLPTGTVGAAYRESVEAVGGSQINYQWSHVSGALPPGLSFVSFPCDTPTKNCVGILSGTPTQDGSFTFTVRVTDSDNNSAQATFTVVINKAPTTLTIDTSSLPKGTYGQAYSATLKASGGTESGYNWSLSGGSLLGGLSLSESGVISGTPTETNDCSSNFAKQFTVQVADSGNSKATKTFCISIFYGIPRIDSLSPSFLVVDGQNHTIGVTGANFTSAAYETGLSLETSYVNSSTLQLKIYAVAGGAPFSNKASGGVGISTGTYSLYVVVPGSSAPSNKIDFRIYDPAPQITKLTVAQPDGSACKPSVWCHLSIEGGGIVINSNLTVTGPGISQTLSFETTPSTPQPWASVKSTKFSVPQSGTFTLSISNSSTQSGTSQTSGSFTVNP